MLSKIQFPEQYVWMDLFCIPQEGDIHRAKLEIANQTAIFQSASTAIAWLPTIPSWDGLRSAIELIALQYLIQDSYFGAEELVETATVKAKVTTYLVELPVGTEVSRDMVLEPWFTSLWTLQELCLRPDMLLCDISWRKFVVGDLQVPVDHIMALFWSKSSMNYWQYPLVHLQLAADELTVMMTDTNICQLLEMSRMTVLTLRDLRHCESRRAEAIMSVIGCTRWFRDTMDLDAASENLGLEKYPIGFVQEVRNKMKGMFFATVDYRLYGSVEAGTLLPLSQEPAVYDVRFSSMLGTNSSVSEDHPSLSSWVVDISGAVLLPEVGIVSAYPPRGTGCKIIASISWPQRAYLPDYPEEPIGPVDLDEFLASFWSGHEKYAVHLSRVYGSLVWGIILMEEPNPANGGIYDGAQKKTFRKLCNFNYIDQELDASYPV